MKIVEKDSNRNNKNKAVYTAYVAHRRPRSESITYIPTDRRSDGATDRRTDTRSYKRHYVATKNSENGRIDKSDRYDKNDNKNKNIKNFCYCFSI